MSWDDDGRFPKDRSFPRSQAGRAALRPIDGNDSLTWLRKRRMTPDGIAEARNKGGYLTVKAGTPSLPDGFYAVGDIGAVLQVVGDDDGRGMFKLRGPFLDDDGHVLESASALQPFGDGRGFYLQFDMTGFVNNKQGYPCRHYVSTVWATRNGTNFTQLYGYVRVQPSSGTFPEGVVVNFYSSPPSRYGADKSQRVAAGFVGVELNEAKEFNFYYVKDTYDAVSKIYMPTTPEQYPYEASLHRIGPSVLISLTRYVRSTLPAEDPPGTPVPDRIDNSLCPGYRILFSFDNGDSWTEASGSDIFSEYDDTVLTLEPIDPITGSQDTAANTRFYVATVSMNWAVFPVSATRAIVRAQVPYYAGTTLRMKVKLGVVDIPARTVTATLTMFDGLPDEAVDYRAGLTATPVAGGVLVPHVPSANNADPPQFFWTVDGVSLLNQPPFIAPSYNTGAITAISPKEVGLVAYIDGEYVLMSSLDLGATWKKRALLTKDGPVPNPSFNFLSNFTLVSQLRDKGMVARSIPGAPWACDARLPAPP